MVTQTHHVLELSRPCFSRVELLDCRRGDLNAALFIPDTFPGACSPQAAAGGSMLSSVSKMLGEGMAMAEKMLEKAAGELSLAELEEKVRLLYDLDSCEIHLLAFLRVPSTPSNLIPWFFFFVFYGRKLGFRFTATELSLFARLHACPILHACRSTIPRACANSSVPKVPEQLRMVDVAETEYIASIMALNGYNTEFQPEMEKKLKEFSLLEECRITFIKEVLLRLDQASKGMLACLLGHGGTLEALSLALSRIDAVRDASSQLSYVRNCAGMQPLPATGDTREALDDPPSCKVEKGEAVLGGIARVVSVPEEQLVAITQGREATGAEVLELSEDGCENVFFAGRDGVNEAVRVMQEMCSCLGEVVSAEENHTRDLLRLLQRHGYGSRVSQSKAVGGRSSIGMMEDVMANISKPSSSACAGAIAGEGQTLTQVRVLVPTFPVPHSGQRRVNAGLSNFPPDKMLLLNYSGKAYFCCLSPSLSVGQGWNCSAVGKALVAVEAHTGLAHALADGSCATAVQVNVWRRAVWHRFPVTWCTYWVIP